jgi:hypothetical protein
METSIAWSPAAGLNVLSVERGEQAWTVTVESRRPTLCPGCGAQSKSRHGIYWRTLRDLSAQGAPVVVNARLGRWRCRNQRCGRRIFTERVPDLAAPFARRTARLAEIVRLLGHSAGGRPSERLMRRLGMPVSDTTILAGLRKHTRARSESSAVASVHVAGVDDWAWRKGSNYGTIIVDLERREVVDVLADRSAATAANWFKDHPDVEVINRDCVGLYAEAAREGAPQARQVADRFHLLQNFRETIERQLGGYEAPIRDSRINTSGNQAASSLPVRSDCPSDAVASTRLIRRERQAVRQQLFDEIRAPFEGGSSIGEIPHKLGLGRRRVERWVRRIDLPDRNPNGVNPFHPGVFRRSFGAAVGRRHHQSPAPVRRDTPSWLFRVLQSSGAFPCSLARRRTFTRGRRAGGDGPSSCANAGSDDWSSDLAADRSGALRQTPWPDDCPAGRHCRRAESGVRRVHSNAAFGDALSRLASWKNAGGPGRLADRRPRIWHLRDAALCEDHTSRH